MEGSVPDFATELHRELTAPDPATLSNHELRQLPVRELDGHYRNLEALVGNCEGSSKEFLIEEQTRLLRVLVSHGPKKLGDNGVNYSDRLQELQGRDNAALFTGLPKP